MAIAMRQITNRVLMIRPKNFGYNDETAGNNIFQHTAGGLTPHEIQAKAVDEFDALVEKLRSKGVVVDVVDDSGEPIKPDAIFPNNWITMHEDGSLITYPMYSLKRRQERREDIIDHLSDRYNISKRYSFEYLEEEDRFLEGTGSMILDRVNGIVYACLSPRTSLEALEKFSVLRGMERVFFHAYYKAREIYHTNVLMALGKNFVVCCMQAITDREDSAKLLSAFERTEKELIEINVDQMASFAGNMLQLAGQDGRSLIVMSGQAYQSLEPAQIAKLAAHGELVYSPLDNIEYFGGGSARCMIAENFLPITRR